MPRGAQRVYERMKNTILAVGGTHESVSAKSVLIGTEISS
jgi:hypothetical protein